MRSGGVSIPAPGELALDSDYDGKWPGLTGRSMCVRGCQRTAAHGMGAPRASDMALGLWALNGEW